jgi:hypothetical protein
VIENKTSPTVMMKYMGICRNIETEFGELASAKSISGYDELLRETTIV